MKDQKFYLRILLATGIIYEIFLLVFLSLNLDGNIPLYMFVYFEIFLLFFLSWYLIKKLVPLQQTEKKYETGLSVFFTGKSGNYYLIKLPLIIIAAGILFRITLIPSIPTSSPDVYRYFWEGKTNYEGYNPYLISPDSPQMEEHRENSFYDKVIFKHLTSLYPPLSQYIFTAGYVLTNESTAGLKIIFLICETLTLIFLLKLLLLKRLNPLLILLYAWLPLPVMEYFINAHHDAAGIMFLVLFIYYFEKAAVVKASLFFAFAVLVKPLPLILLPVILKISGLKNFIKFSVLAAVTCIIFYIPYLGDGADLFGSLVKYAERWEFNGSVYNLFKYFTNGQISRIICGVLFVLLLVLVSIKEKDFIKGIFFSFILYFIFASTLYPWYLGWAAAVNPFVSFLSLMSLFFTINFSNFTPLGEVWKEYTFVLLLEYIPFFGLLVLDLRNHFKTKTKAKTSVPL